MPMSTVNIRATQYIENVPLSQDERAARAAIGYIQYTIFLSNWMKPYSSYVTATSRTDECTEKKLTWGLKERKCMKMFLK